MELSGQSVGYIIHQVIMVAVVTFRKEVGEYFSSSEREALAFLQELSSVPYSFPFGHFAID